MSSASAERISQLIRDLASPDNDVQVQAESTLINTGRAAVDQLMAATKSPVSQVRWRAAWSLGQIGDRRAFEAVAALLDDPDEEVRHETTEALGHLGDPRAIGLLVDIIRSAEDDVEVAQHASHYVAGFGQKAVAELAAVLESGTPAARRIAAYALGNTGATQAIKHLAVRLHDPESRHDAAVALAKLGDSSAADILFERLGQDDEDTLSDGDAAYALQMLGSPAVPALVHLLESGEARCPGLVIGVIGEIGDNRAVDALTRLLGDPELDYHALIALGKCHDVGVMPRLFEIARDTPDDWDIDLAMAIAAFGNAALEFLAQQARSNNRNAREMAACALGEVPEKASVDVLATLLDDPDSKIQKWAGESLCGIADAAPDTLGDACLAEIQGRLPQMSGKMRRHAAVWSADIRSALGLPPHPVMAEIEREMDELMAAPSKDNPET